MISRIVLFRFKPEISDESINETLDMPRNWKGNIEAINDIQVFQNLIGRDQNNYHAGFLMTFLKAGDIDAFSDHVLHKQFASVILEQTQDIQVFDYK